MKRSNIQEAYKDAYTSCSMFSSELREEMEYLENVAGWLKGYSSLGMEEREHIFRPLFKQLMLEKMGKDNSIVARKFALLKCVKPIAPIKSVNTSRLQCAHWAWKYLHNSCGQPMFKERVEILFSYLA